MKLLEIYKSILRFAGMDADEEGLIYTTINDTKDPALLNGIRLVLPTQHHLKNCNVKEKVVFHPLSENILRGESEVITRLLRNINIRTNVTFSIIGQTLLQLVASPALHARMDPDQAELLIQIKDVDEQTVNNFVTVMVNGIKADATNIFSNIYLKRGGSVAGKRHSRAGITTFATYETLLKDEPELFGVKLRVKDREAFRKLYQFIYPNLDAKDAYNRGSDSDVAPYLDAMMQTGMSIAARLNDILVQYKDFVDEADALMFDSDWVETFENLNVMIPEIRRIPAQMYNEGAAPVSDTAQPAIKITQPELPVTQPQAGPAAPAAVSYPNFNAQPQYPPAQQQFQPPVQQRPEVVSTSRGIDWKSARAANPVLGANSFQPAFGQQMQYPQQPPIPSWAAPAPQFGQYPQQQQFAQYPQQQQPYPQQQQFGQYPQQQQPYPQQFGQPIFNRNV